MSGITGISLNGPVEIVLQIEDGNGLVYPQAEIYGDGVHIPPTVTLTHVSEGLYRYVGYTMPNVDVLTIQYIVYSDITHNIESPIYGRDVDVYMKDAISPTPGAIANAVWDKTVTENQIPGSFGRLVRLIKNACDMIIGFLN